MSFEFAFTTVWNFFWAILLVFIIIVVIGAVINAVLDSRPTQGEREAKARERRRQLEEAERRKKEEEEKQKLQIWVEFYMKEKKRRLKASKMSPLQKVLSKIPPLLGYLLLVATDGLFIYWAINTMLIYKPEDKGALIAIIVLLSPFIALLIAPIVTILRRPSKFEKAKKILASNKTLAREIVKSMPNEG